MEVLIYQCQNFTLVVLNICAQVVVVVRTQHFGSAFDQAKRENAILHIKIFLLLEL